MHLHMDIHVELYTYVAKSVVREQKNTCASYVYAAKSFQSPVGESSFNVNSKHSQTAV